MNSLDVKKIGLFLALFTSGAATAMLPRVIPEDLVATAHGEAITPLKNLRLAVLMAVHSNDLKTFEELLPSIAIRNWADREDYKVLFYGLLRCSNEEILRKFFDHTVALLQSPESESHLRWLKNTIDLIESASVSHIALPLRIFLEYIDEGKFPADLYSKDDREKNLKGLLIERLLSAGHFQHLRLLADRGVLTPVHCVTPLAKEVFANLGRTENEQEYRTDIFSRQFSLTNQCGDLMQAIDAHDSAWVEAALKTCPVNTRIEAYGEATPLMRAIHACIASSEKEPHMHAAAQKILRLLLDHEDVDVNLCDRNNRSALAYAACFNNPRASKALEILLKYHDENKKPLSVLTKPNAAHKVFTWAIEEGHLAGACALAQRKEIDTNLLEAQGKNALHLLASQNRACTDNPEACQKLVLTLAERGARFNAERLNHLGQNNLPTDLMPLADARNNATASVLFSACAGRTQSEGLSFRWVPLQRLRDHELQDKRCLWFRELWSRCHRFKIAGARASDGFVPLHIAARIGQREVLELLMINIPQEEMQLDPARVRELCPFSCLTPAMIVAAHGHVPLLKELLACNPAIDLNERCAAGWTPLHFAAYCNQGAMVEYLLSKDGVHCLPRTAQRDWLAKEESGLSPYELALIGNAARAEEALSISKQSGESALQVLDRFYNMRYEVMKLLWKAAHEVGVELPPDIVRLLTDSYRLADQPAAQKGLCAMCNKKAQNKCGRCRNTHYCSQECQRKDWPSHKNVCKSLVQKTAENNPK